MAEDSDLPIRKQLPEFVNTVTDWSRVHAVGLEFVVRDIHLTDVLAKVLTS